MAVSVVDRSSGITASFHAAVFRGGHTGFLLKQMAEILSRGIADIAGDPFDRQAARPQQILGYFHPCMHQFMFKRRIEMFFEQSVRLLRAQVQRIGQHLQRQIFVTVGEKRIN
jgi:hypothetical protein